MTREEMLKDRDDALREIAKKRREVNNLQYQIARLEGVAQYLNDNLEKENDADS